MEKERRKSGVVVSGTFLLSIIMTLGLAYSGYVITNMDKRIERIEDKQEKNFDFLNLCQERIMGVKETISAHLAWHSGNKDSRKEEIR